MSAILPVSPFRETSSVNYEEHTDLEGFDGTIVARPACAAAPLPPSPYLTGATPHLRECSTPLSLSSTSSSVFTAPCCKKQHLLPPPRTNCIDSFDCDELTAKKVLCRVSCNDNDYDEEEEEKEGHCAHEETKEQPECFLEGHSSHFPPTTAASLVFSSTCCSVVNNGGQNSIHREGQHIIGATATSGTCRSRDDDLRASSSAVVPPRASLPHTSPSGYFPSTHQLKLNECDDGGLSDDEDDDEEDYFDDDEHLIAPRAGGACDAFNNDGVDDDADHCQNEWMAAGRQGSTRRSSSHVEEDRDFITATFDDDYCVSLVVGFAGLDEGDGEDAGRNIPEPYGYGASTTVVDHFFLAESMGDMESSFFDGVSVLGCHDDVSSTKGLEEVEEDSVSGWNANSYLNSTDASRTYFANVHHIWPITGISGASHDLPYMTTYYDHYERYYPRRDSAHTPRLFDNFSNHDYDNSRDQRREWLQDYHHNNDTRKAEGSLFWPHSEGPLAGDRTQERPHPYYKQKSQNKSTDRRSSSSFQSVDQNAIACERRQRCVYRHNPYALSGPVIVSGPEMGDVEKEQEEEEMALNHDGINNLWPKIDANAKGSEAQNNKSRKNNNNNTIDNITRSTSANQQAETTHVVIPKLEWCVLVTGLGEAECKVRFPYRSEARPFPPKPTKPTYPAALAAITPFVKCCYYAQRPHKKCSMLGDACFHAHDDDDGDLVPECFADGLDRSELRSKQPASVSNGSSKQGANDQKEGGGKTETREEEQWGDEEPSVNHDIFVGEGERRRRYIFRAELAAAPCQYGERCIVARHSELAKRVGFNKQALSLYTNYINELRAYTSANLAYRKAVKASRDESEEMYRIQRERRDAAEALKHKDKYSVTSSVPKTEKRGAKKSSSNHSYSRNDPPLIRDSHHCSYPPYLYSNLGERRQHRHQQQQLRRDSSVEYDSWDAGDIRCWAGHDGAGYGVYGESVAF